MSATTTPAAEATFPESKAVEPGLISGGHLVAKALKAEGIDVYRLDPECGALTHVETAPGIENPSFLVAAPSMRYLSAGNG